MTPTNAAFKFHDVLRDAYVNIRGEKFFLTHKPTDHDKKYQTLFGHTHRYGGLWNPFIEKSIKETLRFCLE